MQSCGLHSKPRLSPSHSSVLSCPLSESICQTSASDLSNLSIKMTMRQTFQLCSEYLKSPNRCKSVLAEVLTHSSEGIQDVLCKYPCSSKLLGILTTWTTQPQHKDSTPEMDLRMVLAENCSFVTSCEKPLVLSNRAQKFQDDCVPLQAERVKSQGPFSWSSQRDNLFWQVISSQPNGAHDSSLCRRRFELRAKRLHSLKQHFHAQVVPSLQGKQLVVMRCD